MQQLDDKALWQLGMAGEDSLAAAAVDRFCLSLGSVAGDIALAQGGAGVVIAGGLGPADQGQSAPIWFCRPLPRQGPF